MSNSLLDLVVFGREAACEGGGPVTLTGPCHLRSKSLDMTGGCQSELPPTTPGGSGQHLRRRATRRETNDLAPLVPTNRPLARHPKGRPTGSKPAGTENPAGRRSSALSADSARIDQPRIDQTRIDQNG
jgi:hypothetical protein